MKDMNTDFAASAETSNTTTVQEPVKRGRPVGSRAKPARRNYAAEHSALQQRVDLVVKLLAKAKDAGSPNEMIAVAIETLLGK